MDFLKPTAEHVALYVRFWIGFLFPPASPLKECEGSGIVQPQLIIFLGLGVLVSWIIGYGAGRLGVPDDPSVLFRAAADMDYDDIPLVGLVATFATLVLSAVFHLLARLWIAFDQWRNPGAILPLPLPSPLSVRPHLGGNIYDTINGALGFVAFFAPLGVLIVTAALLATAQAGIDAGLVSIAAAALGIVAVGIYLPSALAATHKDTSYFNVILCLGGVVVAVAIFIDAIG